MSLFQRLQSILCFIFATEDVIAQFLASASCCSASSTIMDPLPQNYKPK